MARGPGRARRAGRGDGASMKNRLVVTYPLSLAFGYDVKLERAIKKMCAGSGAGFGERDLDWHFQTGRAAQAAAARIKRLKLPGIKCRVYRQVG